MPEQNQPSLVDPDEQAIIFVAVFQSNTVIRVHDKRAVFPTRLSVPQIISQLKALSQSHFRETYKTH